MIYSSRADRINESKLLQSRTCSTHRTQHSSYIINYLFIKYIIANPPVFIKYFPQNTALIEPGDVLYLYIDSITQTSNSDNRLYGEERRTEVLQTEAEKQHLCDLEKADVDAFVKETVIVQWLFYVW